MDWPFSHRKWQEANQKIQELQASQEERTDHEQKIKVGASCQSVQLPILGWGGAALLSLTGLPAWGHAQRHANSLVDASPVLAPWEATMRAQVLKCPSDDDPLEIHRKRLTQRTAV